LFATLSSATPKQAKEPTFPPTAKKQLLTRWTKERIFKKDNTKMTYNIYRPAPAE
jgi:hypothetical protein